MSIPLRLVPHSVEQIQEAFEAILALPPVDEEGKPKISLSGIERVEDQLESVRSHHHRNPFLAERLIACTGTNARGSLGIFAICPEVHS